MNISLPDALKKWAETRVAEGRYSSTSDLIRDLLRKDQDSAADETAWLQAMIDEGLRFLFDNSVIGFKVGQSAIWKFKCVYPSQGFVESDTYHVHDGLVRGLGLKEPREA